MQDDEGTPPRSAKLAGLGVAIANPLINIIPRGRADIDPKRPGMPRLPELLAAGVTAAIGQDCATPIEAMRLRPARRVVWW